MTMEESCFRQETCSFYDVYQPILSILGFFLCLRRSDCLRTPETRGKVGTGRNLLQLSTHQPTEILSFDKNLPFAANSSTGSPAMVLLAGDFLEDHVPNLKRERSPRDTTSLFFRHVEIMLAAWLEFWLLTVR